MADYFTFNRDNLSLLKYAYAKAVEGNQEQFNFLGHTLLTSYAKYLIQYLNSRFGIED